MGFEPTPLRNGALSHRLRMPERFQRVRFECYLQAKDVVQTDLLCVFERKFRRLGTLNLPLHCLRRTGLPALLPASAFLRFRSRDLERAEVWLRVSQSRCGYLCSAACAASTTERERRQEKKGREGISQGQHRLLASMNENAYTSTPTSSSGQDVALWPRQPRFKS